jgi:hypothetical protein
MPVLSLHTVLEVSYVVTTCRYCHVTLSAYVNGTPSVAVCSNCGATVTTVQHWTAPVKPEYIPLKASRLEVVKA